MARKKRQFVCKQCEKEFLSSKKDAKYCSRECLYESMRTEKINKTCQECGKEFYVDKYREDTAKYCSKECFNKAKGKLDTNIKCDNCGKEFYRKPSHIDRNENNFCSIECQGEYRTKSNIKEIEDKNNIIFKDFLYGEYITNKKSLRNISEKIYGHNANSSTISDYLKYFNIPIRYGSEAIKTQWIDNQERRDSIKEYWGKTNEEYIEEIKGLYKDEYIILEEYQGNNIHLLTRHNNCGHEWEVTPANLLRGFGCPKCASSKGEKKIALYLDNNNKIYDIQFTFEDCRNKLPLPFDFYLPDYNLLIEYDGEQHFKPVNFGGISDDEALINHKKTKKNDKIKNTYCLKNNIKLLRIPYWDFNNIEYILEEALSGNDSVYFIA